MNPSSDKGPLEKAEEILESHNFEDELRSYIRDYVNQYIEDLKDTINSETESMIQGQKYTEDIIDNVDYIHDSGGKRLRPLLTYLSFFASGGENGDKVTRYASSIENIQGWTLIIDDIADEAESRRGRKPLHKVISPDLATQIALQLNSMSYSIVQDSEHYDDEKKSQLMEELSKANFKVANGQIKDLLAGDLEESYGYVRRNRINRMDVDSYKELVNEKSGGLIEAACSGGGIIADAEKEIIESLQEYAKNFGWSFQIKDDILDLYEEEKPTGKDPLQDLKEGKSSNFLVIKALEEMDDEDAELFLEMLKKKDKGKPEIAMMQGMIHGSEAKEKGEEEIKKLTQDAKESLKTLEDSQYKETLKELLDFNLERSK